MDLNNLEPRYLTETELYIQYWTSVADDKINNDKEGTDSNGTEKVYTR